MRINLQFNASLPVKITRRKKWFLASCPILDIHSQGDTEEKAKQNLSEALSLFFISCFERGTLDAVLKGCGFQAVKPPLVPPRFSQAEAEDFINVPIPFLVNTTRKECRA
ncbi:MAG: type II toxin-antitoxin system HicB family antitoxin [Deltaproteobacteria bacterium]|nr:type II toxin-antitoxin system HicB family antitoxin [Deltaproteobacteria bacterium]